MINEKAAYKLDLPPANPGATRPGGVKIRFQSGSHDTSRKYVVPELQFVAWDALHGQWPWTLFPVR